MSQMKATAVYPVTSPTTVAAKIKEASSLLAKTERNFDVAPLSHGKLFKAFIERFTFERMICYKRRRVLRS